MASKRHVKKPKRYEDSPPPPPSRKHRNDLKEALPDVPDEEYFPGSILMARRKSKEGKIDYLIAWDGYDTTTWSWEPSSCLDRAGLMIQEFLNPIVSLNEKIMFCCRLQV